MAAIGENEETMRYLAKHAILGLSILLSSTLAQGQPPGGGPSATVTGPGNQQIAAARSAINQDILFSSNPICGLVLIVHSPTKPDSFYNADRNPWGAPAIVPFVDALGPGWMLIFGGPNGPCFSRTDPRFYDSAHKFLGLHFGFYTNDSKTSFFGSPCWLIGADQAMVPCSGITGRKRWPDHVDIHNGTTEGFVVRNAAVAFSPVAIPVNSLNRVDLPYLDWHPLALADDRLPAAAGDQPGTLTLGVPLELQKPGGFILYHYEVADPITLEVRTAATLEVPSADQP
jgi:hypothetical protein